MKKILFLLAALAYAGLGSAQSIEADTLPTLPPHVYCEIPAHHLPTHRNNGVLFDFGQKTEVLKYNSGEENSLTPYLLRIAPARLTAEQRTALLTPLQGENPKPGKKR